MMQTCPISLRPISGGWPYFVSCTPPAADNDDLHQGWDNLSNPVLEPQASAVCLIGFPVLSSVPASAPALAVPAPPGSGQKWSWKVSKAKARKSKVNLNELYPITAPVPTKFPLPDLLDVLVSDISRMEIEHSSESSASTSGSKRVELDME
jgi:hypothetical protein